MNFVRGIEINYTNDKSVKEYESIISIPSTAAKQTKNTIPMKRKRQPHLESIVFNKIKFFKAATEDNVQLMEQINFTNNDINSVDQFGWSALMIAACASATNCVRFLLNQQVDLSISDKSGNTALTLAQRNQKHEILDLINEKISKKVRRTVSETSTSSTESFFCKDCNHHFSDTTKIQHDHSTLHCFNQKNGYKFSKRYHIPDSNIGFKMMVRQGWDRECGLGPNGKEGKLYPVKTTLRKTRSGLGTKQDSPPRITHFSAFDRDAVKWRPKPKPRTRLDIDREAKQNRKKEIALRHALS